MPEGHTTEPNAKLKAVYRGHSHPATFMGGLFTATDDREQEYICCQADPDNLPDHIRSRAPPARVQQSLSVRGTVMLDLYDQRLPTR